MADHEEALRKIALKIARLSDAERATLMARELERTKLYEAMGLDLAQIDKTEWEAIYREFEALMRTEDGEGAADGDDDRDA